MLRLTQTDLLNTAFKQAVQLEENLERKYSYLSKEIKDKKIQTMYKEFSQLQKTHIDRLVQTAGKLNVQ